MLGNLKRADKRNKSLHVEFVGSNNNNNNNRETGYRCYHLLLNMETVAIIKRNIIKQNQHTSVNEPTLGKYNTRMMWFYITLPIFMGLGRCPIVSWDFAGAVSIFGPDALPVVHQ